MSLFPEVIQIVEEHRQKQLFSVRVGRIPLVASVVRSVETGSYSSCSQQPDNAGTPGSVLCHSPLCSHCRLTHQCQAVCQDSDDVFSIITSGNGLYGCFCNGLSSLAKESGYIGGRGMCHGWSHHYEDEFVPY